MLPALPLAAAVVGALLGATLAYWLQRARPLVVIDSIRMTVEHASDQTNIKVNRSLVQRLYQYERELGFRAIADRGSATEREYVLALSQAQRELQDEMDNYLPRIQEAAREFREHLINEDYELADQSFARNSSVLWEPLAVAALRGQFKFPGPDPKLDETERQKYHDVTEPDDGVLVIQFSGPFNAVIDRRFGATQAIRLKGTAERVANALAYRYRPDLLAVVQSARTVAEERMTRVRALADLVSHELDPYRRFLVEGIIANAGRTSFSVSNRSKFIVHMKGYRSRTRIVEDDSEILLRLGAPSTSNQPNIYVDSDRNTVSSNGTARTVDFSTPVLVQPGQSQRFTCVSDSVIADLPFSEELLQAFSGGNQVAYLALGSIRNRRRQFSVIYSRNILFRDLVYTAELPRRSSRWTRQR